MIRATGHVQVFVCIQPTDMRSILPESLPEGHDAHVAQNHAPTLISYPNKWLERRQNFNRQTPSRETDRREFAFGRSTFWSYRPTRVTDSLSSVRSDKPEGVKSIAEIPSDFTRSCVIVSPPSVFSDKLVLRRWEW
jgi:hypothetical protein